MSRGVAAGRRSRREALDFAPAPRPGTTQIIRAARLFLYAGRQREVAYSRLPAPRRRRLVVLVDVPEGAVVGGINIHRRVITPAVADSLRACSIYEHGFTEGHLSQWVTAEPAGVADTREDRRRVGDAEAECHVAVLIHCDTAHPAVHAVIGGVRALLEEGDLAASASDLVPAHPSDTRSRLDRLVGHKRLIGAEIAVGKPPGRPLPVGEDINLVVGARLRDTLSAARGAGEERVELGDRELRGEREGRARVGAPLHRVLEDIEAIERRAAAGAVIHRADEEPRAVVERPARAVYVRRKQSVARKVARGVWLKQELDHARIWLAVDHLVLLERIESIPSE